MRGNLQVLPGARVQGRAWAVPTKSSILVLAGEDPGGWPSMPPRWSRSCARCPASANVESTPASSVPNWWSAPTSARAADLARDHSGHRRPRCASPPPATDSRLPKMNLAQRQVPVVVKPADDARRDLLTCWSGWRCQWQSRTGARLFRWRRSPSTAGRQVIDRYDRLRNVNFEIELNGMLGEVEKAPSRCPLWSTCRRASAPSATRSHGRTVRQLHARHGHRRCCASGVVLVLLFHDFRAPGDDPRRWFSIPRRLSRRCSSRRRRSRCRR